MKMLFNTILLLCSCIALRIVSADEDDDHLSQMASTIMQHLNAEHIPMSNGGGADGSHNMPAIHQIIGQQALANHALTDRNVTNIKASVGVAGIRFVSVEYNGKVVNITTKFGVGAAAVYLITSGDDSDDKYEVMDDESYYQDVTDLLKPMTDRYTELDKKAAPNETSVLLGQKAKFGLKIKLNGRRSDPRDITAKVKHGFIVCARTNVTKGVV